MLNNGATAGFIAAGTAMFIVFGRAAAIR